MSFKLYGTKYRIGLRLAIFASIQREGEPNPARRGVAASFVIANPVDVFDVEKGAKLAVSRALRQAFMSCERAQIWPQILGKVEKKAREVFADAEADVTVSHDSDYLGF